MANFEALIRGALSAKGATTPEDRALVYQSSRNALTRLIEGNRSITVESAMTERKTLEEAIAQIEAEFQPIPDPARTHAQSAPDQLTEPEGHPDLQLADIPEEAPPAEPQPEEFVQQPVRAEDPFLELQQVLGVTQEPVQALETAVAPNQPTGSEGEIVSAPVQNHIPVDQSNAPSLPAEALADENQEDMAVFADEPTVIPSGFARRRKKQRNWFWFFVFLFIIALLAWLGYRTFLGIMDGSLLGLDTDAGPNVEQRDDQSSYFNIVEPGDLTALVVSDRGRVEIVNEQGLEMIRILSVRNQADRAEAAKPILLRLKPGVIEQIRGKRVTAEIFARSGKSTPAQFAIECQFGAQIGCGRKRFRVGVQPEASIFAFTMEQNRDINSDAFIAISTDITDNASITGEGDILDIVYVRLRTSKTQ